MRVFPREDGGLLPLVNECLVLDPVLRTRLPLELPEDDIALLRFGNINLT